jgi:site-specific recombinase XerD
MRNGFSFCWRLPGHDVPCSSPALQQPCAVPVSHCRSATGREIDWINQYLDCEMLRRLADTTLRTYAHELLHFLRWWESVHHTDVVTKDALTQTTLLEYVRFQSGQERELTGATINQRVAIVDRALRAAFPDAPHQAAPVLQTTYWQRAPMGIGKPRAALSRLRVKTPKRTIVPLSVDEVARFWSSFRNSRDLAIVGLMLLQGLRSQEVLDLNRDDLLLSEAQIRVRGKGSKTRFLPLAPGSEPTAGPLFAAGAATDFDQRSVCFSQGTRPRCANDSRGVALIISTPSSDYRRKDRQPHRFRHTFASDMVRAGVSLPALMQLMGHAQIQTTMIYVQVTPLEVYQQYACAVSQHISPVPRKLS